MPFGDLIMPLPESNKSIKLIEVIHFLTYTNYVVNFEN